MFGSSGAGSMDLDGGGWAGALNVGASTDLQATYFV